MARLHEQLAAMNMKYVEDNFESLGQKAAVEKISPIDYLAQLIDGETNRRDIGRIERRITAAKMPVLKRWISWHPLHRLLQPFMYPHGRLFQIDGGLATQGAAQLECVAAYAQQV